MVQRLVRGWLLPGFAGAKSPGARRGQQKGIAWRLLAAPHQDLALFGTLQHSAGIPIRRLRLSPGARRSSLSPCGKMDIGIIRSCKAGCTPSAEREYPA